ncbi:uncharacterized protein C8A04DRAFT_39759 [Dichotomopilus funicola]|uniref:SIS domain-containing protein n=1 Tax=Dichotomopilus funicola TaxID=1934379 RepID=A0AAN6UXG5_9PEZI|nr:hypothetical protein C8A04DRAFT_39759 [Dichotomopilus funicola]
MVQLCQQQRPIQNSEVYVLRQVPPFPPLSPPSPITPAEDFDDSPVDSRGLTQPDIAVCGKKLAVEERIARAVHVLATETAALQNLTQLYSSDSIVRDGFTRAVDAITSRHASRSNKDGGRCGGGKLVVIGVGKSGHIAKKLVATFNSLAIHAIFLHPTEALHGDLGQITPHDTLLLITFSGKTPELLALLPHLDPSLPLILLTSHTRPETCEIIVRHRQHSDTAILLPAPIHEAETASFGVSAPTTSTTVALAVGDALAIVAARELHPSVADVFARNHPGGAIGAALWANAKKRGQEEEETPNLRAVMVSLEDIPILSPTTAASPTAVTGLGVLRAGYSSPSGWVWLPGPNSTEKASHRTGGVVSPRTIRGLSVEAMAQPVTAIPRSAFIPVTADTSVSRAAEWIRGMRTATAGSDSGESDGTERSTETNEGFGSMGTSMSMTSGSDFSSASSSGSVGYHQGLYDDEAIMAIMEKGECVGLLEIGTLLGMEA